MATYAIGDVQGCYSELNELLSKIGFKSDRDRLWFCGDLVNRGPQSLDTLRFIQALGDNAITVLGNHDLHLLAVAYNDKSPGKKDTLNDILEAVDRDKLLDWLRSRPLLHHDSKLALTLVHAGIHPSWSIAKAVGLASEFGEMVAAPDHRAVANEQHRNAVDRAIGGKAQYVEVFTDRPRHELLRLNFLEA